MKVVARILAACLVFAVAAGSAPKVHADESAPLMMAAASLKNAFDQVATNWKSETGKSVTMSYAASSALAKQIEQGAPADLFASADQDWMNYLQERHLIKPDTRSDILGNSLVLIAPEGSQGSFAIEKGADLGAFIGDGRLAVADVNSVPAGKYAKQALQTLDMWSGVENKLAPSDNVRSTLALVARGEAVAGIVYATDAKIEPKVKVLATFPANSHDPIIYPVAIVATSKNPNAEKFLAYLHSPAAQQVYATYGFTPLQ